MLLSNWYNAVDGCRRGMVDLESLVEYSQIVRRLFASEDEGFQFYNAYSLKKGFIMRRSYVEWDAGHNQMTLRKFV